MEKDFIVFHLLKCTSNGRVVFCLANERSANEDIEALMTLRQAMGQDSQDFVESLRPVLTHKPTPLPHKT